MVKLNKGQLIVALKKLGVEVDPAKKLTNPKLEALLVKAEKAKEGTEGEGESKVPPKLKPEGEKKDSEPTASKVKAGKKDYLQKFQYGKDVPLGHPSTNPVPGTKAYRMKQHLLKQEPVRIIIMREQGESPSILASVNLNGYRLDLPKSAYVEVPEQIANIIMKSQKQQNEALEFMRIDLASKDKKDALGA